MQTKSVLLLCILLGFVLAQKDDSINDFVDWIVEGGLFFERCEVGFSDEGLVALKEIALRSQGVVYFPSDLAMSHSSALKSAIGHVFRENSNLISGGSVLALHLLWEKQNPSSHWASYIKTLPSTPSTPMFWSQEDRNLLTGSWVLARTVADEEGIQDDYDRIFPTLFKKYPALFAQDVFTPAAYKWAFGTLWSRAFYFDSVGQVMLPLFDTLHTWMSSRNELSFNDAKNRFELHVKDEYKANEPIYFFRGPRSNNDLLRLHGYIEDDNPNNVAFLDCGIPESDPYYQYKTALLASHNLNTFGYPYSDPPDGLYVTLKGIPRHVIAHMRIKYYEPSNAELTEFERSGKVSEIDPYKLIEESNERKMLLELNKAIMDQIEKYPESFKDDEKLLEKSTLTQIQRTAIAIRHLEKKILNKARWTLMRPTDKYGASETEIVH